MCAGVFLQKKEKKSRKYFRNFFLCLKITQNVAFDLLNFAFSTNFCPVETDLAGNTVWPQALCFQKLAKMTIFGIFT